MRGHTVANGESPSTIEGALGQGIMRIAKVLYRLHKPVTSSVELQKGDITSEFSHYMERSEQIPTAVSFETVVDASGQGIYYISVIISIIITIFEIFVSCNLILSSGV